MIRTVPYTLNTLWNIWSCNSTYRVKIYLINYYITEKTLSQIFVRNVMQMQSVRDRSCISSIQTIDQFTNKVEQIRWFSHSFLFWIRWWSYWFDGSLPVALVRRGIAGLSLARKYVCTFFSLCSYEIIYCQRV